jgi:hypothetical protein
MIRAMTTFPVPFRKIETDQLMGKSWTLRLTRLEDYILSQKKWDWRELLFYSSTPRSPFLSAKEEGGFLPVLNTRNTKAVSQNFFPASNGALLAYLHKGNQFLFGRV